MALKFDESSIVVIQHIPNGWMKGRAKVLMQDPNLMTNLISIESFHVKQINSGRCMVSDFNQILCGCQLFLEKLQITAILFFKNLLGVQDPITIKIIEKNDFTLIHYIDAFKIPNNQYLYTILKTIEPAFFSCIQLCK